MVPLFFDRREERREYTFFRFLEKEDIKIKVLVFFLVLKY